jgi:hypothetical protein
LVSESQKRPCMIKLIGLVPVKTKLFLERLVVNKTDVIDEAIDPLIASMKTMVS